MKTRLQAGLAIVLCCTLCGCGFNLLCPPLPDVPSPAPNPPDLESVEVFHTANPVGGDIVTLSATELEHVLYSWTQTTGVDVELIPNGPSVTFTAPDEADSACPGGGLLRFTLRAEMDIEPFEFIEREIGVRIAPLCNRDIENRTLVVVDWTGRDALFDGEIIFPDDYFPTGADLSTFVVWNDDGTTGTAADFEDELKEGVRATLEDILRGLSPSREFSVVTGEAEDWPQATRLYMVNGLSPTASSSVIGQASLDRCNTRVSADSAFVFAGGRTPLCELGVEACCDPVRRNLSFCFSTTGMARLGGELLGRADLDNWINALSDIGAHEIGHTIGFGHHTNDSLIAAGLVGNQGANEVMLAARSMNHFMFRMDFRIDLETCPDSADTCGCEGIEYDIAPYVGDNPYVDADGIIHREFRPFPDNPRFAPNLAADIETPGIPVVGCGDIVGLD